MRAIKFIKANDTVCVQLACFGAIALTTAVEVVRWRMGLNGWRRG